MEKFKTFLTDAEEQTLSEMTDKEREAYYKKTDKAMSEFVKGLTALTKKTGISIETTGGLYYDDPKTIKSVSYSEDFSSGDLRCKLTTK